jgi:hypothetical protein
MPIKSEPKPLAAPKPARPAFLLWAFLPPDDYHAAAFRATHRPRAIRFAQATLGGGE